MKAPRKKFTMLNLKGGKIMSTMDDLKEAFAGESQANRKYLAFAKKADKEGYSQIAKLFRAAAQSETIHALEHLRVMGQVGSTADNLKAAIEGETYEFQQMYPGFIDQAEKEGNKAAVMSFKNANAVEQIHAGLFKKALDDLRQNKQVDYYICPVCGNVVEGNPPEFCPICRTLGSKFMLIE